MHALPQICLWQIQNIIIREIPFDYFHFKFHVVAYNPERCLGICNLRKIAYNCLLKQVNTVDPHISES